MKRRIATRSLRLHRIRREREERGGRFCQREWVSLRALHQQRRTMDHRCKDPDRGSDDLLYVFLVCRQNGRGRVVPRGTSTAKLSCSWLSPKYSMVASSPTHSAAVFPPFSFEMWLGD